MATTYWKSSPSAVAHEVLRYPLVRTVCGRTIKGGARFEVSDLPSGERFLRICTRCEENRVQSFSARYRR